MNEPRGIPAQIDHATGLPEREVAIAISTNPSPQREENAVRFALEAAKLVTADKCEDVLVLDLRGRSQITDVLVLASGTSSRQMRSAAYHVEALAKENGLPPYRDNLKENEPDWVFLDLVDVVVHIFEPETRRRYDLEMLWGDAPRLDWEGDIASISNPRRNRAGLRPDDILPS